MRLAPAQGAPWGSAGARGCADSGECGGLMRPLRWLAWWPGLASAESDEAGSSVERKVRCEPAVAGRLSGSGHGHRRKATAGAGHAPGQLGQSSSAAMSRSCSSRGWSCGSCWIEGSRFPRRRRWGRSALCTCAGIASSAPPLSRRVRTPHGIWIYLNGHEWAKRPRENRDICFEALTIGFARLRTPTRDEHRSHAPNPRGDRNLLPCSCGRVTRP